MQLLWLYAVTVQHSSVLWYPATFLGVGLAGVEIKDHIKKCFFWIWGVSIICLIAGLILGVIKL